MDTFRYFFLHLAMTMEYKGAQTGVGEDMKIHQNTIFRTFGDLKAA